MIHSPGVARPAVGEDHRRRLTGIPQGGDNQRRLAEVLVRGEVVHGDQARDPGAGRGEQAVARVLDDDGAGRGHAEVPQGERVDVRGRLLVRHDVAREHANARCQLGADGAFEGRLDRGKRRGGRDGHRPPGVQGRADQAGDPRPRRDGTACHEVQVDLRLAAVPGRDDGPLALGVFGQAGLRDELGSEQAGHALLAAADQQLLTVLRDGPADGQAELLERLVERDEVAVPLGVGDNAVAVEDERAGHGPTPPCRRCRSGACARRPSP